MIPEIITALDVAVEPGVVVWGVKLNELVGSFVSPKYHVLLINTGTVSYTHLTLPTNREV